MRRVDGRDKMVAELAWYSTAFSFCLKADRSSAYGIKQKKKFEIS